MDTRPFHRILLAWDGSPGAQTALRIATRLPGPEDGHIIALAVLPPNPHAEADDERARELTAHRQQTQTHFDDTIRQLPTPLPRITLHLLENRHIAKTLTTYSTEHALDLIVVGRHGQSGTLHPDLGPVARDLAKSASVPLLIV